MYLILPMRHHETSGNRDTWALTLVTVFCHFPPLCTFPT